MASQGTGLAGKARLLDGDQLMNRTQGGEGKNPIDQTVGINFIIIATKFPDNLLCRDHISSAFKKKKLKNALAEACNENTKDRMK